ncbi:MAG: protein kinase [Alphaproteobacteria bacterium]|nr:protein kinase [Alphaproteobacteria bacterium]
MAGRGLHDFSTPVPLGRGGMGLVYRATHLPSGAEVALKRLPDGADEVLHRAFRRELEVVARIDHPHIVDLLAAGVCGPDEPFPQGTTWIAMELARGSLRDRPPTTWEGVREVARAVLAALATVHAHDVLHRDLTPGNVLDTGSGWRPHWRLADFGLARLEGRALRGGTAGFRPPEVGSAEGPWTDVYAAGCLVWWMVHAGRTPDETPFAPAMDVPEALATWLHTALSPHPQDRFDHARHAWLSLAAMGRAVTVPAGVDAPTTDPRQTWLEDETASPWTATVAVDLDIPDDWHEVAAVDTRTPLLAELRGRVLDAHSPLLPRRPPPMIGRLEACDALWAQVVAVARGGGPRTLRLLGPPGVGHTRMLDWLQRTTRASGASIALMLRDRGEGPGPEPTPGTLRVVVDAVQGAIEIPLAPLEQGSILHLWRSLGWHALPGRRGSTSGEATWLTWLTRGLPARVVETLDRLEAGGWRADGRGPATLVPTTPGERDMAGRMDPETRAKAGRAWLFDGVGGWDGAACYEACPPELRRRWHAELALLPQRGHSLALHLALAGRSAPALAAYPNLLLETPVVFDADGDPELAAAVDDWRTALTARPELSRAIRAAWLDPPAAAAEHAEWAEDLLNDPDTGCNHLAIVGRWLVRIGRTSEARAVAQRAHERPDAHHPSANVDPRWLLGWTALLSGDLEEAERWLSMPFRGGANERGEVARLRGDLEGARRWYEYAVREHANVDAHLNLVDLLIEDGRFDAATRELARVRWHPDAREVPFMRCALELVAASLAERVGDTLALDRALEHLQSSSPDHMKGDPDFLRHTARLSRRLEERGDHDRAALVRSLSAHW